MICLVSNYVFPDPIVTVIIDFSQHVSSEKSGIDFNDMSSKDITLVFTLCLFMTPYVILGRISIWPILGHGFVNTLNG